MVSIYRQKTKVCAFVFFAYAKVMFSHVAAKIACKINDI